VSAEPGQQAPYLDALANFEYKAPEGEAAEVASSRGYEDTEQGSMYGGDYGNDYDSDARSSDESDVVVRVATVLYDFDAENDDEVAVKKGDEVGGAGVARSVVCDAYGGCWRLCWRLCCAMMCL
jgi:hypothetical protein